MLSILPGLGRSWFVPVYVLNGRNTIPGLMGTEDPPSLLNASPHPYQLPFYTLMQQAHLDDLVAQQAQNEEAWNAPAPAQEQIQENGWRAWPVVPPPYTGFSFRSFFEYDGPSLMDGVDPEQNVHDNLSDVWASEDEVAAVESLADGFINGNLAAREAFARAGGDSVHVTIMLDHELLL